MPSIMPQHEGGSNVGFANLVIWILARGPEYSELVAAAVHLIPGIKKNVLLRNPVPDFLAFTYVIDTDDLMCISKSLRKPVARDRFPAFS